MAIKVRVETDAWQGEVELVSTMEEEPWRLMGCITGSLPYGTRLADGGHDRVPMRKWHWYPLHSNVERAVQKCDLMCTQYPDDQDLRMIDLQLNILLGQVAQKLQGERD
jgi:hypothetical protein